MKWYIPNYLVYDEHTIVMMVRKHTLRSHFKGWHTKQYLCDFSFSNDGILVGARLLDWNLAQIMPKLHLTPWKKKSYLIISINYSFRLQLTHSKTDRKELRNPHKLMISQSKTNKFHITRVLLLLYSKLINYYCVRKKHTSNMRNWHIILPHQIA